MPANHAAIRSTLTLTATGRQRLPGKLFLTHPDLGYALTAFSVPLRPRSEIDTLAYPRAALFGFCLVLVAYNLFQVALTALDSVHQEPVFDLLCGPGNRGDVPGLADWASSTATP